MNWKPNWKVKQYYPGTNKLSFEGEYLNGKKNGKGKFYFKDGPFLFEGEYLNGILWNAKIYEGDKVEAEIKNGKGKMRDIIFTKKKSNL